MLNLTRKKVRTTRKARYMLEAGQIVTSLCHSVELPEGFVAEYKVAVKAVLRR